VRVSKTGKNRGFSRSTTRLGYARSRRHAPYPGPRIQDSRKPACSRAQPPVLDAGPTERCQLRGVRRPRGMPSVDVGVVLQKIVAEARRVSDAPRAGPADGPVPRPVRDG
jgi:hypothetical protein